MFVRLELSRLFVAFTIELDNAFEDRLQTAVGQAKGPWLTSYAMWSNFLRYVPSEGIAFGELAGLGRITNVDGVRRWRYVTYGEDLKTPRPDSVVRLTRSGALAARAWGPLAVEIEQRWRERFGPAAVDGLRAALAPMADPALPCHLPVVRQRMYAEAEGIHRPPADEPEDLVVLLSRVLLAHTLEVERDAAVSLPVGLNVLRVLTPEGVAVRDLPTRSGVSKEGISMVLNLLVKAGRAVIETNPTGRGQRARLTAPGRSAYQRLLERERAVETRWGSNLDRALAAFDPARLAAGLRPPPNCWRAQPPYRRWTDQVLADPAGTLPHYPMVLHRGGFPDGS
jgi:DNA-binding MarR family transcriptional regulator